MILRAAVPGRFVPVRLALEQEITVELPADRGIRYDAANGANESELLRGLKRSKMSGLIHPPLSASPGSWSRTREPSTVPAFGCGLCTVSVRPLIRDSSLIQLVELYPIGDGAMVIVHMPVTSAIGSSSVNSNACRFLRKRSHWSSSGGMARRSFEGACDGDAYPEDARADDFRHDCPDRGRRRGAVLPPVVRDRPRHSSGCFAGTWPNSVGNSCRC